MGAPIPKRIAEAPELLPGLEFFLVAFNHLKDDRQAGSGYIGHIPYSAMSKYCDDYGITGDQREDLLYHVRELDNEFVKFQRKAIEGAMKAQQSSSPKGKTRGRRK